MPRQVLRRGFVQTRQAMVQKLETAKEKERTHEVVNRFVRGYPAIPKLGLWLRSTQCVPDLLKSHDLERVIFDKMKRNEVQKYMDGPALLAILELFVQKRFKLSQNLYELSAFAVTQGFNLRPEDAVRIAESFRRITPSFKMALKAEDLQSYSRNKADYLKNFRVEKVDWSFVKRPDGKMIFADQSSGLELELMYVYDYDVAKTQGLVKNILQRTPRCAGFVVESPPWGPEGAEDLPATKTLTRDNLAEYGEWLLRNNVHFEGQHKMAMINSLGMMDHLATLVSYITLADKFEIDFIGPTSQQIFSQGVFPQDYGVTSLKLWEAVSQTTGVLVDRSEQNGLVSGKVRLSSRRQSPEAVSSRAFKVLHHARSWTKSTDMELELFAPFYDCFVRNLHSVIAKYKERGQKGRLVVLLNGRRQFFYNHAVLKSLSGQGIPALAEGPQPDEAARQAYLKLDRLLNSLDVDWLDPLLVPNQPQSG